MNSDYVFQLNDEKEYLFKLPEGVFVPTETTRVLINGVRNYATNPGRILDLGCGAGVVGLVLHKLGLVKEILCASDLSFQATESVKENANFYNCDVDVRCGSLFEPWKFEKFDYIINDVSGVSDAVAPLSPWFENVPCVSGVDGTLLTVQVIEQSVKYINDNGSLFFPVISFSDVNKVVETTRKYYQHVDKILREEWPLPKQMYKYMDELKSLKDKGYINYEEKFGMVVCYTEVYVAHGLN